MNIPTAREAALARAERIFSPIPPITHPLGRSWNQPNRARIEIDDKFALMSQRTFDELADYSCSRPSGVYEGKMWKRHDGIYDPDCDPADHVWLLCWYGFSEKPGMVSNNHREIVIV